MFKDSEGLASALPSPKLQQGNSTRSGPSTQEGRGQEMVHKGRGLQLIFKAVRGRILPGIEAQNSMTLPSTLRKYQA